MGSGAPGSSSDALSGSVAANAVAGATAGATVLALLFPVDVAKTHMQAKGTSVPTALRGLAAEVRASGAATLYRGIVPALGEQMLNRSMLFGVGSLIKSHVPAAWPEPARDAASGASAALVKTSLLHPVDTVKCRWQLGMPRWQLDGLYRGLAPAVLRSSAGMAIWLASRNELERSLPDALPGRHLASGALSSAFTDLCTFPFDTLKKNMQAGRSGAGGVLSEARGLLREGGVARFYRGYAARFVIITCNGALFNHVFVVLKARLSAAGFGAPA